MKRQQLYVALVEFWTVCSRVSPAILTDVLARWFLGAGPCDWHCQWRYRRVVWDGDCLDPNLGLWHARCELGLHSFAENLDWYWVVLIPTIGGVATGLIFHY